MSEAGFEEYKNQQNRHYTQKNLTILFVAVGIIAFFYFNERKTKAKEYVDLESLSYEATKMASQSEDSYLHFSSENPIDVETFLNSNPEIKFKGNLLTHLPNGWSCKGASVLDFGKEKVFVTLYKKEKNEKVYLFTLKDPTQIKQDSLVKKGDTYYSLHASKDINMLVWKTTDNTLNVLVGWESTKKLSEFL